MRIFLGLNINKSTKIETMSFQFYESFTLIIRVANATFCFYNLSRYSMQSSTRFVCKRSLVRDSNTYDCKSAAIGLSLRIIKNEKYEDS